jgi:hypothetical protein
LRQVRTLVDHLMAKEYDLREPLRRSDQEVLQGWEASMKLIDRMQASRGQVRDGWSSGVWLWRGGEPRRGSGVDQA